MADSSPAALWNVSAVVFEGKLAFEAVVDRFDPLANAAELAQPRLLVYAVAADEGGIAGATVSSNWRPARRVTANFSGRSGAHRPLADDRARCVQLTIRAGAGAHAFAHRHQPGSGRRRCWWSTSGRGAGVTALGVEQQHDRWALRPTSPATVTGRAVAAGAASLETRGKENRRGASTARRPHPRAEPPVRRRRQDTCRASPSESLDRDDQALPWPLHLPAERPSRSNRPREHDPVGAASWCPWITRVGPWARPAH